MSIFWQVILCRMGTRSHGCEFFQLLRNLTGSFSRFCCVEASGRIRRGNARNGICRAETGESHGLFIGFSLTLSLMSE